MAAVVYGSTLTGLAGDRPAATLVTPGVLFLAADTGVLSKSDGSVWTAAGNRFGAGDATNLGVSFGTTQIAANRIGLYGDLTAGSEKLGFVVGGVSGPLFTRNGSAVDVSGIGALAATTINGAHNGTLGATTPSTIVATTIGGTVITSTLAATQDALAISGRAGGTGSWTGTLTPTTLTASRTYTLPDASIVLAGSAAALTNGRIVGVGAGGILGDSANLTIDPTTGTGKLGIGMTTASNSTTTGCATFAGGVGVAGTVVSKQTFTIGTFTETAGTVALQDATFVLTPAAAGAAFNTQSFKTYFRGAAGGSTVRGMFSTLNVDSTASGTINIVAGWESNINVTVAATVTNCYGARIYTPAISGGGAITNNYGIFIHDHTGGAVNYAIFSGIGLVRFGDTTDASAIGTAALIGLGGASIAKSLWVGGTAGNYVNIANSTGELRVNGTKVLGVQGAAVADAAGGVVVDVEGRAALNALLARMRTHGAIAT